MLSLLGSYINIPVAQLPAERLVSDRESSTLACVTSCPLFSSGRAPCLPSTWVVRSFKGPAELAPRSISGRHMWRWYWRACLRVHE